MTTFRIEEVCPGDIGGDLYALSSSDGILWGTGGTYGTPVVVASSDGKHFWTRKAPDALGLRGHKASGERLVVVGEYGTVFVSSDRGAKWKKVSVGTEGCLFAVVEDASGAVWIAGDDGFVARSIDGVKSFTRVRGLRARINAIVLHEKRLFFLGHDGALRTWNGKTFDTPILSARASLNGMAVTPEGTLVVVSNGGVAHRSTDGGRRWRKIDVESDADLEAVAWTEAGLLVVGDDGTILLSEDDGISFEPIESDSSDHYWAIVPSGTGAFVAGDNGAIIRLFEDGDPTWEGKPDLFGSDLTERAGAPDGEEDGEDREELAVRILREAETPIDEAELRKASARWIREGIDFKKEINAYVRRIYSVGYDKAGEEPEETRKDMAPFVMRAMVQLNREKRFADLRRLFPAAYEPFDYEEIGQSVGPVFPLDDGRVLASVARQVYAMDSNEIAVEKGVVTFGVSPNRRFFAKLGRAGLTVHDGWNGPSKSLPLATELERAGQIVLHPFPDGERVLVSSDAGIFVTSKTGSDQLHPEIGSRAELSYPHAALSRDGTFIALGSQDSAHLIYRERGGSFELCAVIDPGSEYPNMAGFHDVRDYVALCSCHFARSATLGFDLSQLKQEKKNGNGAPKPSVLRASARAGGRQPEDKRIDILDAPRWIWAVLPRETGFLLGDRSGYLWNKAFDGTLLDYTFLGSTVTSLAQSKDKRRIVGSTYAGYVIELDTRADTLDPHLLTSAKNIAETRRWVFWQGFAPMIW